VGPDRGRRDAGDQPGDRLSRPAGPADPDAAVAPRS